MFLRSFVKDNLLFRIMDPLKRRPPPKTTISGNRQRNAMLRAFRWRPNIECWLGSYVIFQGIRTGIAKKYISFVLLRKLWVRALCPLLWTRTCLIQVPYSRGTFYRCSAHTIILLAITDIHIRGPRLSGFESVRGKTR